MTTIYSNKLDAAERGRIERLEIFDEFEEWILLQNHYCICLAQQYTDETKEAANSISL